MGSFLRIHNEITHGLSGAGPKNPSGSSIPIGMWVLPLLVAFMGMTMVLLPIEDGKKVREEEEKVREDTKDPGGKDDIKRVLEMVCCNQESQSGTFTVRGEWPWSRGGSPRGCHHSDTQEEKLTDHLHRIAPSCTSIEPCSSSTKREASLKPHRGMDPPSPRKLYGTTGYVW